MTRKITITIEDEGSVTQTKIRAEGFGSLAELIGALVIAQHEAVESEVIKRESESAPKENVIMSNTVGQA